MGWRFDPADFRWVGERLQQCPGGPIQQGMMPIRIQLDQWSQDESAEVETGMRDHQLRLAENPAPVREDVQVYSSRSAPVFRVSTQCLFHFQADFPEFIGLHLALQAHNPVQEPAWAWVPDIGHRLGFVERRDGCDLCAGQEAQEVDGPIAKVKPVAEIRAEPNEHCLTWHNHSRPTLIVNRYRNMTQGRRAFVFTNDMA